MKASEFWKLIEKSKRGVESPDEQAEKLEGLLANLSPEEILSFDSIFNEYRHASLTRRRASVVSTCKKAEPSNLRPALDAAMAFCLHAGR